MAQLGKKVDLYYMDGSLNGRCIATLSNWNCNSYRIQRIQLKDVGGTIYTATKHCGGIIGLADGTTSLSNCHSSVNIISSINDDGTHGGLIASTWTRSTTNITGCVFDGSIQSALGYTTDQCGGFVGWRNGTINVKNSLMAADTSTIVAPEDLQYPTPPSCATV